jgi:hypothetical protein
MMLTSNSVRRFLLGAMALGGLVLAPGAARASEVFPGAIQQYANMPCAPSCLLCHTTNPGNISSWTGKPFGYYLGTHGVTVRNTASLKVAFDAYAADPTNAGGLAKLKEGIDPDNGNALCGPTYGCGAHVAKKAPPTDFSAPLWVIGAVVAGGLLRRRRTAHIG